jgi:hypothetical protein
MAKNFRSPQAASTISGEKPHDPICSNQFAAKSRSRSKAQISKQKWNDSARWNDAVKKNHQSVSFALLNLRSQNSQSM